MLTVVLDTNALVSGLLSQKSWPAKILDLVLSDHIQVAYGLKTSTEETNNKYPSFPTIYEQKSKLTMLESWSVILKRGI